MSDPNYEHRFWTNRKGLCQQTVSGKLCHLPEDAVVHTRWVERHPDVEQEPHADDLQARLSRYETAIREALAKLDTPLGKWKSIKDLYSAACHRSCDGAQLLRVALSDQPAEEPAESKLETLLRTRHDLRQEHEKLFTHSWAICTDEQKSYYAACKDLSRVDAAILDAQPSTPEPKGE